METSINTTSRTCLDRFRELEAVEQKRGRHWACGPRGAFEQWLSHERVLDDTTTTSLVVVLRDDDYLRNGIVDSLQDIIYYLSGLTTTAPAPPKVKPTRRRTRRVKRASVSQSAPRPDSDTQSMQPAQESPPRRAGSMDTQAEGSTDDTKQTAGRLIREPNALRRSEKMVELTLERLKRLSSLSRQLVEKDVLPADFSVLAQEPLAEKIYPQVLHNIRSSFPDAMPDISKRLVVASTQTVSRAIRGRSPPPLDTDGPPDFLDNRAGRRVPAMSSRKRRADDEDETEFAIKRSRTNPIRLPSYGESSVPLLGIGAAYNNGPRRPTMSRSHSAPTGSTDVRAFDLETPRSENLQYVCVASGCTDPCKVYDSQDAWLKHMADTTLHNNQPIWICTARCHGKAMPRFVTAEDFKKHMREVHPQSFQEADLDCLAIACQQRSQDVFEACTVCNERCKPSIDAPGESLAEKPLLSHIVDHFRELDDLCAQWARELQFVKTQQEPVTSWQATKPRGFDGISVLQDDWINRNVNAGSEFSFPKLPGNHSFYPGY